MAFFKRSLNSNYHFIADYAWAVPGFKEIGIIVILLILGSILGNFLMLIMQALMGASFISKYGLLVSYPLIFIPAMIYTKNKSIRNKLFAELGYNLDNNNFGSKASFIVALTTIIATIAAIVVIDPINIVMPPMPQWLQDIMSKFSHGSFFINFMCVSIMAPIFEEWLCRGMVLRGLLNYKKSNGKRGIKPLWAIIISALFFGILHLNPWQAIPAFIMGALFGYVYYKTGSLKLTMLMHFTNNSFALIMYKLNLADNTNTFYDIMPQPAYIACFICAVIIITLYIKYLHSIKLYSVRGNCKEVKREEV